MQIELRHALASDPELGLEVGLDDRPLFGARLRPAPTGPLSAGPRRALRCNPTERRPLALRQGPTGLEALHRARPEASGVAELLGAELLGQGAEIRSVSRPQLRQRPSLAPARGKRVR